MVVDLKTDLSVSFQVIVYSIAKLNECQLFARHCVRLRI